MEKLKIIDRGVPDGTVVLAETINELIDENQKLREAIKYMAMFDGKFTDKIDEILN
jgi:hypothetical protein